MDSKLAHVNLELVSDFDKAQEFMRWLGQSRRVLGVDTETGGVQGPHRNRLRLIQFGDLDTGWALPWETWSGLAIDALNRYEGELVFHNAPFDSRYIIHHAGHHLKRWKWELINDTMTMAHLIDPLRPKALKKLAAKHIDPYAAAGQDELAKDMRNGKWTWDTVPADLQSYWVYGALDPVLTAHLYEHFLPQLTPFKKVYDLEMAVIRIVSEMMLRGSLIDVDYCMSKREELGAYANKARDWLDRKYGLHNMGSNQQLVKCLQDNGIELSVRTDGGDFSVKAEVLEHIDHPIAKTALNIRKAEKMIGPYFDNFIELRDSDDRVHPTIWPMGTRTGRMTVTEPALQTLPRKDPTVRTAFIAKEGHTLVTSDYDQIEARLTAHFSNDQGLIDAFLSDADFFCTIASQIFQTEIVKKDPRRQVTKNTVYGKVYGAGPPTMAHTAGIPVEQMYAVVDTFDRQYPGVKRLMGKVESTARQRASVDGFGWVTTPAGRREVCDKGQFYTLLNYLIQGHAADILKMKMVELSAVGLGPYMLLPVHDEVLFEIPDEEVPDAIPLIKQTMENLTDYAVPITASPEVPGDNWGDKYR